MKSEKFAGIRGSDTGPSPLLTLEHVTVRHLHRILFADLSLTLLPGQHWAVVGPSGAGKSALLAALAGQLLLTGGTVAYAGLEAAARQRHPTDPLASWRQVVSLVGMRAPFQARPGGSTLYYQQRYEATAAEEVPTVREYLLGRVSAPPRAWTYARVVDRLRLAHLQAQPLIQLSNGETKRLRLAAALLRNPALLLLDNPLAGLDVATRADFDALLAEVAATGCTVVLATSPGEIPQLLTHVAELAAGQLVQVGQVAAYVPAAAPTPALPDAASLRALWPATPPAFTTLVKLEDVTIRYGERLILDHLSWEIKPGERWALLGPNGAGKSTIISLLNGDNPQAYRQRLTLFDRRRSTGESIWEIKRQIGYVSPELLQYFPGQPTCLHVVASGFADTLGLGRRTPEQLATARAWLSMLHLGDYATEPLQQVPASVQRLCLVARALVKNPPLLLLDEPGQGLDAAQQPYFRAVLEALCAASPVALVFVSHYAEDIPRSVTHVLELRAPGGG